MCCFSMATSPTKITAKKNSSSQEDDNDDDDDDDRTKSSHILQAYTPHNHITLLKTVNISDSNNSSTSDIHHTRLKSK